MFLMCWYDRPASERLRFFVVMAVDHVDKALAQRVKVWQPFPQFSFFFFLFCRLLDLAREMSLITLSWSNNVFSFFFWWIQNVPCSETVHTEFPFYPTSHSPVEKASARSDAENRVTWISSWAVNSKNTFSSSYSLAVIRAQKHQNTWRENAAYNSFPLPTAPPIITSCLPTSHGSPNLPLVHTLKADIVRQYERGLLAQCLSPNQLVFITHVPTHCLTITHMLWMVKH